MTFAERQREVGRADWKGVVEGNVREGEGETVELMSTDPPVGRPAFSYWTLLWKEEIIHLRQRRSGITCRWTDCDCVTSPAALSGPISLMQCTSSVHTPTHTHADGRTEQCSSWKVHLKYVFISFWNVDYIGRKYLQPFSPICPGRSYLSMQHLEGFFCWRSPFSVYLSTKNSSENNCLSLNRPKSLNSTLEKAAWECKLLCDIVTKRQNAVEGLESQGTTGMKKKNHKRIYNMMDFT